jgi:hypothetical protein
MDDDLLSNKEKIAVVKKLLTEVDPDEQMGVAEWIMSNKDPQRQMSFVRWLLEKVNVVLFPRQGMPSELQNLDPSQFADMLLLMSKQYKASIMTVKWRGRRPDTI